MKQIKLTQGKIALVDNEDFEWLSQWKWSLKVTKWGDYVYRQKMIDRKSYSFMMHREILEHHGVNLDNLVTDHINHDGLDNRKENLRAATNSQNQMNRRLITTRNGYKGVNLRRNGKYRASSTLNQKSIHLGYFNSKEEAARAYNKFAKENFGEFALFNQIGGSVL